MVVHRLHNVNGGGIVELLEVHTAFRGFTVLDFDWTEKKVLVCDFQQASKNLNGRQMVGESQTQREGVCVREGGCVSGRESK